jgi:hypothetical protein
MVAGHCTAIADLRASGCQWVPGCHGSCSSASFVTAAPVSFAALHSSLLTFAHYTIRSPSAHLVPFRSFVVSSFQYCSVHPLPIICSPALPTSAALSVHPYGSFPPSFAFGCYASLASFRRLSALTGNLLRRLHMELASASPGLSWAGSSFTASPSWGLAAASVPSSLRRLRAARRQSAGPQVFGPSAFLPQALLPSFFSHNFAQSSAP